MLLQTVVAVVAAVVVAAAAAVDVVVVAEDVALNEINDIHMKQKINFIRILVFTIACATVPLLYIHQVTNHINPYHLNGKQFLPFFMLLSFLSVAVAVSWLIVLKTKESISTACMLKEEIPQPQHCMILVIMIGIVRLIQGISNEKPVGFLVMLLFADAVAFFVIRFFMNEVRRLK